MVSKTLKDRSKLKRPAPIVPKVDPSKFFKRQRREDRGRDPGKLGSSVHGSSDNVMEDDNVPYGNEEDEDNQENQQLADVLAIMPNQANNFA